MIRSRNPSIVAARDVKPGHVIVLPDGTIKTLDDVILLDGSSGNPTYIGNDKHRTAIALHFKYTDGTSQLAHPATQVQLADVKTGDSTNSFFWQRDNKI